MHTTTYKVDLSTTTPFVKANFIRYFKDCITSAEGETVYISGSHSNLNRLIHLMRAAKPNRQVIEGNPDLLGLVIDYYEKLYPLQQERLLKLNIPVINAQIQLLSMI